MKRFFILIVLLGGILSGCTGYREVNVKGLALQKVKLVSASSAEVLLRVLVDNPTRTVFTVSEMEGVIWRDGVRFAEISLTERLQVPPGSGEGAEIRCRVDLLDPLAILVMGLDIESWDPSEFELDLKTTIRAKGLKKAYKINRVPLERLVRKFRNIR